MSETWRLGRHRGIDLAEDFVAERMRFVDTLHAEMRTSMQHDLENGGRLEAPWLCGAVARMSEAAGLAAPVNRSIYAALKPYIDGSALKAS
jgi:2-dehydropantoate 2-reductase